ncbi:MAG: sulfite exporter TauE/SafE family protein, partial [Actinobacteria bacterium]
AGAVIGFLGGVVGLILGSLRMPALLRFVRADTARVIGTNLLVGVCVGVAGIAAHAPSGVDWTLFAIGSAASVPGALLGARLTGRLDERRLLQAVGIILVTAGVAAVLQGAL